MGVTIYGAGHEINMGYGGFMKLRCMVARGLPLELQGHYLALQDMITSSDWDAYNKETDRLDKQYNYQYALVLDFLYAPDTGKSLKPKVAKAVLKALKDYDGNPVISYPGIENPATLEDFRTLLKAVCKKRKRWGWL